MFKVVENARTASTEDSGNGLLLISVNPITFISRTRRKSRSSIVTARRLWITDSDGDSI